MAAFTLLLILAGSAFASDRAQATSSTTESVIYNFTTTYSNPYASLTADANGNLYGTAFDGTTDPNGAIFELSPNAGGGWSEKALVIFNGRNGAYPYDQLVFDGQGNLYGTTAEGGNGPCFNGCGVVFELSPSTNGAWKYSILYSFQNGNDGASPLSILLDPSGNIYGVTGFTTGAGSNGTVYELERPKQSGESWTYKELFLFNGTNGFIPNSLAYSGGALYGTTSEGGSSNYTGTVFQLKPENNSWTYNLVYAFTGCADGGFPGYIGASGTPGVLYGTANGGQSTYGVIFKITANPDGTWTESVLYNFMGGTDGVYPGPLTITNSDQIFGTTNSGGDASACSFLYPYLGCGTVFEFVPSTATETVLHAFTGPPSDGGGPYSSGVTFGKGGKLYGTTYYGGNGQCSNGTEVVGCGVVYSVSP